MDVPMSRDEAIAVNGLIYGYLRMRHLIRMAEGLDGKALPGSNDGVVLLANRAHKAIGVGIDGELVNNAWSNPRALDEFLIGNKRKVKS